MLKRQTYGSQPINQVVQSWVDQRVTHFGHFGSRIKRRDRAVLSSSLCCSALNSRRIIRGIFSSCSDFTSFLLFAVLIRKSPSNGSGLLVVLTLFEKDTLATNLTSASWSTIMDRSSVAKGGHVIDQALCSRARVVLRSINYLRCSE